VARSCSIKNQAEAFDNPKQLVTRGRTRGPTHMADHVAATENRPRVKRPLVNHPYIPAAGNSLVTLLSYNYREWLRLKLQYKDTEH